jgi:serine protease Do
MKVLSVPILAALLAGVLIGTLSLPSAHADSKKVEAAPLTVPAASPITTGFSQLAKQLEPSVVNISTTYEVKAARQSPRNRQAEPDEDSQDPQDFLFRFFGETPQQGPRRSRGVGSGFIVDKAGYIITNHHVVDKADVIKVKVPGESTEFTAKVIGSDEETDLAVIRIDPKGTLVPAKMGNSDAVQVGDWSIAIGSPFGLSASVTAGIISAKNRDVATATVFQHFLQTDAAINPGNSGGPLVNVNGEVIGVNTQIATRTGGYQGIGFAVPSNTAVKVYNAIIQTGKVTRGSIGISFNDRQPELLKAYGAPHGVFVQTVQPGGPAEKAGVRPEDIILSIDGKDIHNGQELIAKVSDIPVGQSAAINVLRAGKKMDFRVEVGDRTKVFAARYGKGETMPEEPEATPAKFGISIESLNEQQRNSLGLEPAEGVRVASISPGSFAEEIGMQQNDILIAINRQPVKSVEDVRRIQGTLKPGDAVAFRLLRSSGIPGATRGGWVSLFLAGTLPN